jgi:ribonuclease J
VSVSVTFLGGLGEIGRNCAALEIDGRICLIDCGLMFPEEDMLGVDLVFPDWSWLAERRDDVDFVILTHGHEDHMGALGYFLRDFDVPVYGSKLSTEMAKGRIEELGIQAQLHPVALGEWRKHGPFRFRMVRVSHSIPDATAIAFDTPEGLIVHSGDFKLDPTPIDGQPTDLPTFAELGRQGVRLLLSDSTNAEEPGFVPSEASLRKPIEDVVAGAEGRIIAACFSSHVHRVQQIVDAGLASGRKIAFFGRSMHRNTKVAADCGHLRLPQSEVVDIADLLELPVEKQLLITTGSQGEPFAALSLMARSRHKFVDVREGDTILISAKPIPGNETAVSRVISRLTRLGAHVVHGRNAAVHVSGHAARDELLTFLNVIRPQAFVPVHGEYRHLDAHGELARAMGVPDVEVLEDGDRIVLDGRKTDVVRRAVPAGYVYLDGASFGDVQAAVLRDRSHLADEGVVVVTVGIDRDVNVVFGPEFDSHGLMDDPEAVLGKAADAVRQALAEGIDNAEDGLNGVQRLVRQATARTIRHEVSRKPVVIPVVFQL